MKSFAIPRARSDTQALRETYIASLTPDEIEATGARLGAGARHPRAWVGPPHVYDLIGANQFQLLLDLGLRDYHRFLDVGCGSLRLGRLVIAHLLNDRYFGVEPEKDILDAGCRMHFGASLESSQVIKAKGARFAFNTDFDFGFTGGPVDFIFAQSIASHTGPAMTRDLLKAISGAMHDGSVAMVTFIHCGSAAQSNTREGWFYPECVSYTDAAFGGFCATAGLRAYKSEWPLSNLLDDGLVTSQQPTILTKSDWQPGLSQKLSAAMFSGVSRIA
ncbi:MAG: class I SAM-dependent methyltransferase [Paracoccaceae bacterium]|nr:class I SAM-dependent methyltransferase [Paracoccaceae bacterium]